MVLAWAAYGTARTWYPALYFHVVKMAQGVVEAELLSYIRCVWLEADLRSSDYFVQYILESREHECIHSIRPMIPSHHSHPRPVSVNRTNILSCTQIKSNEQFPHLSVELVNPRLHPPLGRCVFQRQANRGQPTPLKTPSSFSNIPYSFLDSLSTFFFELTE